MSKEVSPLGKNARKIGLISDTHGLLRLEALRALRDSDLIIHAGDVGKPEILDALNGLAPVTAVSGNIDQGPRAPAWARALPETAIVEAGAASIYVLHDLHQLDLDPRAAGFHIVISGHSHKPLRRVTAGVLYLTPEAPGRSASSCPSPLRASTSASPPGPSNSSTWRPPPDAVSPDKTR